MAASGVTSEPVEWGQLARPEADTHPGLVIIPDVWGLGDHTCDLAARLASDGFVALALDPYRRLDEVEIRDPGAWMRDLSDPDVMEDVAGAVAWLAARPETSGPAVGVVGFCMGGMYALMAGCGTPGVGAVVPFYGILSHAHGLLHAEGGLDPAKKPREPLDIARDLACPLLGFFGARDDFVPVADVEELRRRALATGQPSEIVIYPEAGHAFVNDTRPAAFRPDEAREAWGHMVGFFREHLGAA